MHPHISPQNYAAMLGLHHPLPARAYRKGWHRMVSQGVHPTTAAQCCGLTQPEYAAALGWFKSFRKRLKRGWNKAKRFARKAVKKGWQIAKKLGAILPRLALKAMWKIAWPLARAIGKVPSRILKWAARRNRIPTKYIRYFKIVVKKRSTKGLRKYFPLILAIAAKVVAKRASPVLAAAYRIIRRIPRVVRRFMIRLFPKRYRRYAKIALSGINEETGAFFGPDYYEGAAPDTTAYWTSGGFGLI